MRAVVFANFYLCVFQNLYADASVMIILGLLVIELLESGV